MNILTFVDKGSKHLIRTASEASMDYPLTQTKRQHVGSDSDEKNRKYANIQSRAESSKARNNNENSEIKNTRSSDEHPVVSIDIYLVCRTSVLNFVQSITYMNTKRLTVLIEFDYI